ncbi:hypothetical protein PSECIP111854_01849 [Pseudoalteromonas sp. CIP111854]|uniref:Glycosyltransferase n=1 Tax=Pseudoalteromonas holothuriae TaxID=2963714 RepID=A0A9W4W3J3_9GAMM|nr:hypothetical protein PSECIP111854_01849 [Pseudoalteromonas sp. CIP111854]
MVNGIFELNLFVKESNLKVAYLLILKSNQYDSVYDKVISQVETWQSLGVDVKLFLITNEIVKHPNVEVISPSFTWSLARKLKQVIDCFSPDIIYHRMWVLPTLLVPLFFSNYKLVAELNTDTDAEIKLQRSSSLKGFITYVYNLVTKPFYHRCLSAVVSVTKELSTSVSVGNVAIVPNSIDIEGFKYRKEVNSSLSILFVGTPGLMWHGLDILNQLAKATNGTLQFHVVGMERDVLSDPAENIHFHGYLPMDEYADIAKRCSVGMGTLALHRKGMKEACPLKVREYLAAGLPVILPYEETAFLDEEPSWILKINSSQDVLDSKTITNVVKFTQKVQKVVVEQHDVARFIDSHQIERKRVAFMKTLMGIE